MQSRPYKNLSLNYRNAVVRGDIMSAHSIALQAAHFHEERDDLKLAGLWHRAVSSTLYFRGNYSEAAIEAELSADMQPDAYERARSLILLGESNALCLKPNAAFIALGRAEEIARFFRKDTFLKARIHAFRAVAFSSTGDLDQAIVDAEKGAELDRQSGGLLKAATALNNLGFWLAKERQLKEAERRLLCALELVEKDPRLFVEAGINDSLGYVYTLMGRHDDAELLLKKSANILVRLHNHAELAVRLLHLSELHQQMRQYQRARDDAAQALKLATETKLDHLRTEARNLLLSIESDGHAYPRTKSPKMQSVRDLMKANLHRKLLATEMAQWVRLSPSRFAHLFKAEIGTTPARFIKTARMQKGRELLETTLLSVKEITARVGLSHESQFVRDFKKRYGLTPAQYRKDFFAEKGSPKPNQNAE